MICFLLGLFDRHLTHIWIQAMRIAFWHCVAVSHLLSGALRSIAFWHCDAVPRFVSGALRTCLRSICIRPTFVKYSLLQHMCG